MEDSGNHNNGVISPKLLLFSPSTHHYYTAKKKHHIHPSVHPQPTSIAAIRHKAQPSTSPITHTSLTPNAPLCTHNNNPHIPTHTPPKTKKSEDKTTVETQNHTKTNRICGTFYQVPSHNPMNSSKRGKSIKPMPLSHKDFVRADKKVTLSFHPPLPPPSFQPEKEKDDLKCYNKMDDFERS